MPTLEITNQGNYIVRTHFHKKRSLDEIYSTYQLMSAGITFLNQHGIKVGDSFSYELFIELKRRKLVFTNGSGVSRTLPTSYTTTSHEYQNTQRIDVYASNDTSGRCADNRAASNTIRSDFTQLIGTTKGLNRCGTFFKKDVRVQNPLYVRLERDELLLSSKAYCIVFHHHEIHKIYIPPMIQTKCIGSCHLWEVWAFDIPKCINKTIRRWGIRIGHPIGTM